MAGGRTYEIEFDSDDMPINILVGPNGYGKSIFLYIYYLFVTMQWSRLMLVEFDEVALTIRGGDVIKLNSYELYETLKVIKTVKSIDDIVAMLKETNNLAATLIPRRLVPDEIEKISEESGVSARDIKNLNFYFGQYQGIFSEKLDTIEEKIKNLKLGKVLYLPTFRRIEKEIDFLFKNVKISDEESLYKSGNDKFIELVAFGMKDVDKLINDYLIMLISESRKKSVRASQEFIKDMIQGKVSDFSLSSLDLNVKDVKTSKFVNMLDEDLFSLQEKLNLAEFLRKSSEKKRGKPKKEDQYLGYFVAMMYKVFLEMDGLVSPIELLQKILDGYLQPSKYIESSMEYFCVIDRKSEKIINTEHLSSGEKQIYAVFSYILLEKADSFIVLIDEPELSLSVPWQKTFLEDIISTNRCSQLFSVTHSPFVVGDAMQKNMLDIRSLIYDD